jgi:putative dimethyl sulfoxide reductase chaperone
MTTEDFLSYEAARAQIYKWLADCYYTPGEDIIERTRKLSHHLKPMCPQAVHAVDMMKAAVLTEDGPEALKVEFARLFVGPFSLLAPPYGSVYLDAERKIMGDSALDLQQRYREVGLDLAEDFKDAPDHIAAELEFMHFLIIKELQAVNHADLNEITSCMDKQRSFLGDHLGAWIAPFTQQVEERTCNDYFAGLAAATRLFVENDPIK